MKTYIYFARTLFFLLFIIFEKQINAFHLPGVAPKSYAIKERVPLQVNKVTSTKTQIPYEFYDLPFCKPTKTKQQMENIGEVLAGDAITNSPYVIEMKHGMACQKLCRKEYSDEEMSHFRELIDNDYKIHWIVDGLPVACRFKNSDYITRGFHIGFKFRVANVHVLFNHVRIKLLYNENPAFKGSRIVGFEVQPTSINHKWDKSQGEFGPDTILDTCDVNNKVKFDIDNMQSVEKADEVIYTYDVIWEKSDLKWSERWDIYFEGNPDDEIHYFSIVNSFMISLFLTGVVGMILLRALRQDITNYNEMQSPDEAQEETGWKLVHRDVFRPPDFMPNLFAALAGTGMQLVAMTGSTLGFALLGFMSPANRGGLLTSLLLLYVFMGSVGGYWSATLYKLFGGISWKTNFLLTALLFPGAMFILFTIVDIIAITEGSSTALPVHWILALLLLWFCVSAPLVFVGSYFGIKKETMTVPVAVNQLRRQIPEQNWYSHPMFSIALGGILPFGVVCIELFFIMSALWLHQIYYVFGFLVCVFCILVLTCAEITIVMCYFQLCSEDYRWWWRSFLSSGSSAIYLFAYSIWYFIYKLEIDDGVSVFIYFTYMLMISIAFFLMCGSIGFFACLWFTRKIYGALKVD